jgi:dipeptidyl aminopeptidase/acylaminoacyl peptidase
MLSDLALVDVETAEVQTVARKENIAQYWLSPDGTRVAYARALGFASPASQEILYDILVYSPPTKQGRIVASRVPLGAEGSALSWSPDSDRIAFKTASLNAREECFVVAVSGTATNVTSNLGTSLSGLGSQPPLWDALGQHVFFVGADTLWKASITSGSSQKVIAIPGRTINLISAALPGQLWVQDGGHSTTVMTFDGEEKRTGFFRIDLTSGASGRLREENKSFSTPLEYATAVSRDGEQIVYLAQDTQHSLDLWMSNAAFTDPRQVTHSNPQLERYAMGEGRVISWNGLDGELLHGALLLPAGYQQGRRYPLLVKVYGGSLQSNSVYRFGMQRDLAENLQLFATRGYAVLLPDAPLRVGTPMQDLMKTVLPGVNKVVEMGVADPDRLGLMGHSYGGYSTLCLLVQTPRFKAAMISGALGNLISGYGQMTNSGTSYGVAISEAGQFRMGGPPWDHLDRYVANSPALFLDRIKTPLLIVHGAFDGEVDGVFPFLAEEIFVGLRRLGKSVEYAKYYGEDHWPGVWGHSNQVDFATRVIAWFDHYLQGRAAER